MHERSRHRCTTQHRRRRSGQATDAAVRGYTRHRADEEGRAAPTVVRSNEASPSGTGHIAWHPQECEMSSPLGSIRGDNFPSAVRVQARGITVVTDDTESGNLGAERLERLHTRILSCVRRAGTVSIDLENDSVFFLIEDQDGESIPVVLSGESQGQSLVLVLFTGIDFPEKERFPVLLACNRWSQGHYPHESVSYIPKREDNEGAYSVWLESSLLLPNGDDEEAFSTWTDSFVESVEDWLYLMYVALGGSSDRGEADRDDPKGASFLSRVEAGFTFVAPFLAKAAEVLGDALLDSVADDIRGRNQTRYRQTSGSTQYRQRSGHTRRRSPANGRQQRRSK